MRSEAGEAVTREEFQKLAEQFEKFKSENAQLQADNAKLKQEVEQLKKAHNPASLDSKLADYLTIDEFKPVKDGLESLRSGTTKFLMSGFGVSGFEDRGHESTFYSQFSPTFLFKLSDKISFESRLVFDRDYFQFIYADLSYHAHDLVTLHAGRIQTPFGYFGRNLRVPWIDKLPDFPMHTGYVPFNSTGVMASGAFDAGPTKFNWGVAVTNGPTLLTGGTTKGLLEFRNRFDNNQNKAIVGRLGFLPLTGLELGASFDAARVGPDHSPQSGVDALLLGADLSFTRAFDAIKGQVDLRAEWMWSQVDDALYGDDNIDDNRRHGGYAQLGYRPTQLDNKWASNLELVFRYEQMAHPDLPGDLGGSPVSFAGDHLCSCGGSFLTAVDRKRFTAGLNYWLNPSTVLKFAYEWDTESDAALLMQFAIGF